MSDAENNELDDGPARPALPKGSRRWLSVWIARARRSAQPTWDTLLSALVFVGLAIVVTILLAYPVHPRWLRDAGDVAHLPEALFSIGLVVVFILWWLPKRQAALSPGASAENLFDRENESRKTLAQIIGGVLLLAGLYSSVKTFDLQRKSADLQRQSADFQREAEITDRFTKAVDQLGALAPGGGVDSTGRPKINLVVRIGGIYALERIASDSPRDHWTIMEVLTAYVRENSPVIGRAVYQQARQHHVENTSKAQEGRPPTVSPDVQAILTVVGRRDIRRDPEGRQIDLHGANLRGANLTRAHLEGAFLDGVNLEDALLFEANLDRASLRQAHLQRANLIRANLVRVNLFGSDFGYAHLGEADLSKADLNRADFSNASLIGADLSQTTLNLGKLTGADLKMAQLMGADLVGADLSLAELSGADLSGAHLDNAHLRKTLLSRADLSGAFLVGADLSGADLYGGYLGQAQLEGANLTASDLRGTDLGTVHGLIPSQLTRTIGDVETKLPAKVMPPTGWNNLVGPPHRLLGNDR